MKVSLAIRKTIGYAHSFKSRLNKNEISERLISKKVFSKEEINKEIKKVKEIERENKWSVEKFEKAKILAQKMKKKFSDILFLGISGSVATSHPKKNDDIDFVIITKNNKLWRTRLFLRWWIWKKQIPHRKYNKKGEKDEFCFNLWLDDSNLLLPKDKYNLRNAVDLVLLKPLINKKQTYEKFILANDWVKKWVATPYDRLSACQFVSLSAKTKTNFLDEFMNYLYFWPQYWYMKRKIDGEKIGLHEAFFHRRMVK